MYDCKAPMHDNLILFATMATMGDRIRAGLKAKGLSLRKAGKRIGRSHGAIQNWINGSQVDDADLERIGRVIGKSVKYLRYGDEEPVPQINYELLGKIILSIDLNLQAMGLDMPPEKRAKVTSTLYALFSPSGTVDEATVANIIRLAT